jgi:hypothetical protein
MGNVRALVIATTATARNRFIALPSKKPDCLSKRWMDWLTDP